MTWKFGNSQIDSANVLLWLITVVTIGLRAPHFISFIEFIFNRSSYVTRWQIKNDNNNFKKLKNNK